jgi:hypothetical protein
MIENWRGFGGLLLLGGGAAVDGWVAERHNFAFKKYFLTLKKKSDEF